MLKKLTSKQVASYEQDGFLAPIPGLSTEEVRFYRHRLEAFEAVIGGPVTSSEVEPRYRYRTHTLLPWVSDLVRHPAILDATEELIGPNILVYTTTWFIKEPHSEAVTVWHQDATYFGLRPHLHVTAWVALSDASSEHGCMEFLPGSSAMGQVAHRAFAHKNSINGGGNKRWWTSMSLMWWLPRCRRANFRFITRCVCTARNPTVRMSAALVWPSAMCPPTCDTLALPERRQRCWCGARMPMVTSIWSRRPGVPLMTPRAPLMRRITRATGPITTNKSRF